MPGVTPYRSNEIPPPTRATQRRFFDGDLAGVYLMLWIVSVARVVLGLALHQRFDVEMTIATAAVLLLPVLARA